MCFHGMGMWGRRLNFFCGGGGRWTGEGTSGGDKDERFVTGFGERSERGVWRRE